MESQSSCATFALDAYESNDRRIKGKPTDRKARPFVKWAGGKSQLIPELLTRIPEYTGTYVEPFVGGGALFFAHSPDRSLLCDVNQELMNTYEVVRDELEELISHLAKHLYCKEHFYKVRALDRNEDFSQLSAAERAARMIYLNKTCFNGLYRVNSKGHFNVPFGRYSNPKILDEPNLRLCSKALQKSTLLTAGFGESLDAIGREDFVYLDPPYHPLNETSNFTSYHKEGFGIQEQKALSDYCHEIHRKGAKFLLSNSDTPLIHELYADFNIEKVAANRAINSNASKRGKLSELIVRNYL